MHLFMSLFFLSCHSQCLTSLESSRIPNWFELPAYSSVTPTLSVNKHPINSSYGQCDFNFTVNDKLPVAMAQNIDISNFSVFMDSNEANYQISASVGCARGTLRMGLEFLDATYKTVYYLSKCFLPGFCFLFNSNKVFVYLTFQHIT